MCAAFGCFCWWESAASKDDVGFFLLLTSKIKLYEHLQPGKSECLKEQFHLIGWEGNKMPHFEVFCGFLQSLAFVVG